MIRSKIYAFWWFMILTKSFILCIKLWHWHTSIPIRNSFTLKLHALNSFPRSLCRGNLILSQRLWNICNLLIKRSGLINCLIKVPLLWQVNYNRQALQPILESGRLFKWLHLCISQKRDSARAIRGGVAASAKCEQGHCLGWVSVSHGLLSITLIPC